MKRRSFIKSGSALSLPFFLNGIPLQTMGMPSAFGGMNGDSDRVLVLIQLNGGNDGLNTLIPLDAYDNLANLRSNIILPESSLIQITGDNSFHPSMTGMAEMFDDAKLNIVQSVGYPNQNRSHFRSSDIWSTGSAADEYLSTGWMGRYFQNRFPEYPAEYPNDDCPDPFALTIGNSVSETCQGLSSNYSLAVNNPNDLFELPEGLGGNPDLSTCYGFQLDFVRTAILQTNAYADRITETYEAGNNVAAYPDDNSLANRLKTVAKLISGGCQTRVFIVAQGGYDTHANQTEDGAPTTGEHAGLLKELSDAMNSFQKDLTALGLEERVVGMTFSEFGRQIKSNDGIGTDHGNAAPLFVFGSCINPGIIGDNPDIPITVQNQAGVPMQYDFRSVYGSILMDWFEVPEAEVKDILFDDFQYLPILQPCDSVATNDLSAADFDLNIFPNPCTNYASVRFNSKSEEISITLFDAIGSQLKVVSSRKFQEGQHEVKFEVHDLVPGNYFIRIQGKSGATTKSLIKIN